MEKAQTPDDDQAPEEEAAQTGSPRLSDADRAKDKEREMEESGQELPGSPCWDRAASSVASRGRSTAKRGEYAFVRLARIRAFIK